MNSTATALDIYLNFSSEVLVVIVPIIELEVHEETVVIVEA